MFEYGHKKSGFNRLTSHSIPLWNRMSSDPVSETFSSDFVLFKTSKPLIRAALLLLRWI